MKGTVSCAASLYAGLALFATPATAEPLAEPGDLIVSHREGQGPWNIFRVDPQTRAQELLFSGLRAPLAVLPGGELLAVDAQDGSTIRSIDLQTGTTKPFFDAQPQGVPKHILPLGERRILVHFTPGEGGIIGSLWELDGDTQTAALVNDDFPCNVGVSCPPGPVQILGLHLAGPDEIVLLVNTVRLGRDFFTRLLRAKIDGSEFELINFDLVDSRGMARAKDGSLLVAIGDSGSSFDRGIVRIDPVTGDDELVFEGVSGGSMRIGPRGEIYLSNDLADFRRDHILRHPGPTVVDLQAGRARSLALNLGTRATSFAGLNDPVRDMVLVPGEPAPPVCSDGLDNDGDGQTDWPRDRGCARADDSTEQTDCADGLDNDRDGLVDFGEDDGCLDDGPLSLEEPACDDGIDNDGDGYRDGSDPECLGPWDNTEHFVPRVAQREQPPRCGLIGIEPLLLLALLPAATRRWRQPRAG